MGADTFMTSYHIQSPDTRCIQKAFTSAVSAAQYDYGHAGYTGTIAEKDSFVLCGSAGSLDEARDRANALFEANDPRIEDKWGPAGAITYPDRGEFGVLFFGWAPC